jgi:hypothetical protein
VRTPALFFLVINALMHTQPPSLLVVERCSLPGRGIPPLPEVSFAVPPATLGAIVGPAAARAALFDCVMGERRPARGSLTLTGRSRAAARDAARVDLRMLSRAGTHLTLGEQRALWAFQLHGRAQAAPLHDDGARMPLVALDDAELLSAWVQSAVTSEAALLIVDAPRVAARAEGTILPLLSAFCALRSGSVLIGYDRLEQVPSRIGWRWDVLDERRHA